MLLDNLLNICCEVLFAICIVVLIRIIISLFKNSRRNFPPGPWCLPVVGYVPFFFKDVHLKFMNLSKKHGDVFSLRLGSKVVVVLNDSASIRDAFNKKEFLGRSPNSSFSAVVKKKPFRLDNKHDMHIWQEHRLFLIQSLKDHGKIEIIMQDEIKHFQEVLRTFKGQPIDLAALLTPSLSNNISTFIFGKRYDYNDPERETLDENLDQMSKIIIKDDTLTFFPWIKYIPILMKRLGIEKYHKLFKISNEIFRKRVEEHQETLDKKNIRDFIDSYLVEMEEKQKKEAKTSLIDETLFGILPGIFIAGSETGRTSLGWLMYTMAGFPNVQKKVQEEILEVVGTDRNPEYLDQKSMPFSHAVMLEVMRWRSIVALSALRYTLANTNIAGYDIPAGTFVMANFWSVHHDPRYWEDPDDFKPERFLSPDGKNVVKSPHYMPFSVGKRACPGETMAYIEVFIYFVSLLQKFDVRFPDGCKPTFEGNYGMTYAPPPTKICFIPKNQ